ncbi:MAG TPA: cysteine dioxygenase family protein [Phycisphaerales bacterium]|nr:cysteine dioxygenase family protein [Phycisphaerales bacterium]
MGAILAEHTEVVAKYPRLAELIAYLDGLDRRADLGVLADLLHQADVRRDNIAGMCVFGAKGYRRNTIARAEWYELLALCWRSGDRTPIHDHRGVSCAFKVIEGEGTEVRFRQTPSGLVCPTGSVTMPEGYICAAEDNDIHQVANMQAPGRDLVTLHIYSPPISKMHTYEWGSPSVVEVKDCYDGPC